MEEKYVSREDNGWLTLYKQNCIKSNRETNAEPIAISLCNLYCKIVDHALNAI